MLTSEAIPGLLDMANRQAADGQCIPAIHTLLEAIEVDPKRMIGSFVWTHIAAVVTGNIPQSNAYFLKWPIITLPRDMVPEHIVAQLNRLPNHSLIPGYTGEYVEPPTEKEIRRLTSELREILRRFSAVVAKSNSSTATPKKEYSQPKKEHSQPKYFLYVRQKHEGPYTHAELLARFRDPSSREDATFWTKGMPGYVTVDELYVSNTTEQLKDRPADPNDGAPIADQLSGKTRGITELKRVMLSDPNPKERKDALLEFIRSDEAVEVLVLTGVAVLSADEEIRRLAVDHINRKGNGDRARALIDSWHREGALLTMAGRMTTEQSTRAADIKCQLW